MIELDLDLLAELPRHDRDWFASNRARYEQGLLDQAKDLVSALGPRLQAAISAGIEYVPKTNGSISPINNDLRFRPDQAPYRDYLLLAFWEGPVKKTAPTLHVRIHPDGLGFATGAMLPDLERWREAVEVAGDELAAGLAALAPADIVGQELKRVPKPYDQDHPHADLLRHKWLQARWEEPWSEQAKAAPADFCAAALTTAGPVHRWLVEHLA